MERSGSEMKITMKPFLMTLRAGCGRLAAICLAVMSLAPVSAAAGEAFLRPGMEMPAPHGARGLCETYDWACAGRRSRTLDPATELGFVVEVNRKVNATTRPKSDKAQYRSADMWLLPTSAGGDCEDFALLKKKKLVQMGVDPRRLLLATVLDRRRAPHAVLVYRSQAGDLLLDNLTDDVVGWRQSGYVFLRMQNPERPTQWVGGFRT